MQLEATRVEENRKAFEQDLADAEKARVAFIEAFRETCLRFGDFCRAMQRAQALVNHCGGPFGGAFPFDARRLRDLEKGLDPHHDWGGVVPHLGYGAEMNLRRIAPVKRQFE